MKMKYPTIIEEFFNKLRNDNNKIINDPWGYKLANRSLKTIFSKNNLQFIFEIIQNANDVYAKKVTFVIKEREVSVYHDGRPFAKNDIISISRSFDSPKDSDGLEKFINDQNIIGHFGVGFKSVFEYCEIPQIYTTFMGKDIGFEIRKKFRPYLVNPLNLNKKILGKTKFCFAVKKNLAGDFENFIKAYGSNLLLFLPNINYLCFDFKRKKITFLKKKKSDYLSIISKKNNKKESENKFITYNHKFKLKQKDKTIKLAFKVKNKSFIKDQETKHLFTFFRLKKKTGLFFYLHAPFELSLDREYPQDNEDNNNIKKECYKAIKNCLFHFKNKKYINASFLEILPNSNDEYPESSFENFPSEMKKYIFKILTEEKLWPCENGRYCEAKNIYLHNTITKDFYNKSDLQLCTGKSKDWSIEINEKNYPRSYQLSKDLIIYPLSFVSPSKFLETKNDDWLIQYYSKLYEEKIISSEINIKTTDNSFVKAEKIRFKKDIDISGYDYVNDTLLEKGGKELKNFLKSCGVKDVDLEDEINTILKSYKNRIDNLENKKIYADHLDKILSYFKENSYALKEKLRSCKILAGVKSFVTRRPCDLFIDHKGNETGLSYLYDKYPDLIVGDKEKLFVPNSLSNSQLIELAIAIGVHKNIEIKPKYMSIYKVPYSLRIGRRSDYYESTDYFIDNLEALVEKEDYKISLLISETLSNTQKKYFKGYYKHNNRLRGFRTDSDFIETLKKNSWIPDKQKKMQKPEDLDEKNIDEKFYKIASNTSINWLEIIGFGSNIELLNNALKQNYKNIDRKKIRNLLQSINNSNDPNKSIDNAMLSADTEEEDTVNSIRHRSGPMHSGWRDVVWENKNSINSVTRNKSKRQKERSKEQNNKIRVWLINIYKAHCQVCLAGKKVNELVPNETYCVDPKHRVKIMEAAHADLGKEGGSDNLDNRLLLCDYHHNGMGEKYRQVIVSALKNRSVEYNPFNNPNDKGHIVQTKILGHQSIGPKDRDKENLKIFFNEEHKSYWLKKN